MRAHQVADGDQCMIDRFLVKIGQGRTCSIQLEDDDDYFSHATWLSRERTKLHTIGSTAIQKPRERVKSRLSIPALRKRRDLSNHAANCPRHSRDLIISVFVEPLLDECATGTIAADGNRQVAERSRQPPHGDKAGYRANQRRGEHDKTDRHGIGMRNGAEIDEKRNERNVDADKADHKDLGDNRPIPF